MWFSQLPESAPGPWSALLLKLPSMEAILAKVSVPFRPTMSPHGCSLKEDGAQCADSETFLSSAELTGRAERPLRQYLFIRKSFIGPSRSRIPTAFFRSVFCNRGFTELCHARSVHRSFLQG